MENSTTTAQSIGGGPASSSRSSIHTAEEQRSTVSDSSSLLDDPHPDPPASPSHSYQQSWSDANTRRRSHSLELPPLYYDNNNNNNDHSRAARYYHRSSDPSSAVAMTNPAVINDDNSSSNSSSTPNTTASSSIPTHPHMRRRRLTTTNRLANRPTAIPETIQESPSTLRQSLDAGMMALRRRIRSSRAVRERQEEIMGEQQQQLPMFHPAAGRMHGVVTTPPTHHSSSLGLDDLMTLSDAGASNSTTTTTTRQRALSEPEGIQLREAHFQRAFLNEPDAGGQHQQQQQEEETRQLQEARTRWYLINRRFQFTITIVAVLFSLLLFAILVCWVVLTSSYVISIDKSCNVPLKSYYWLATLQLLLDVFRTDIMRFLCRYQSAQQQQGERIPNRVIGYNVGYLIYALLVLRLGIRSVYMHKESLTCHKTAPELFESSRVFVSLSIAAWSTIVFGYLIPFCFVATLLTWNGYNPTTNDANSNNNNNHHRGVLPAAYTSFAAAPANTISLMRSVRWQDLEIQECCICMTDFTPEDDIVTTECHHVFHKSCCQEWLKQARTCPVCRTDIPLSYSNNNNQSSNNEHHPAMTVANNPAGLPIPGRQDLQHEVVNLIRLMHPPASSSLSSSRNNNNVSEFEMTDVEEGRSQPSL